MSPTPEDLLLIGGSDAAAVAGVHPRKSPVDVFARIVEGVQTEQTKPMRRGLLMEPVIREMYRDETGAALLGPTTIRADWARASLDDCTADKVVEFKSANIRMAHEWGEPGTDDVPTEYLCQVNWYMRLTGKQVADLAVLLGGDELRIYPLRGDLELQEMLWEAAERFYREHVLTRRPPPIDASEAYSEWLCKRYPREREPVATATPEAEVWAAKLFAARATLATAEAAEREARANLQATIGESAGIVGNGWRISWKATKGRTVTDWEAVARAAGASESLITSHTTTKPGPRVFRVTPPKE